jgi:hypothetical protein
MLKKTILGLGAAALISAGALGATAGTASAGIYVGQHGIYVGHHHGHKVCKPIFKKVRWFDKWGHPHVKVVRAGTKCYWTNN